VNCCAANFVTRAVGILAGLTDRPVGGYANAAEALPSEAEADPVEPEAWPRKALDVEGYAARVAGWIDAGASIVGGCCGTGPAHIARLRRLIDERA
jgi:S-methylmethionine-dependent homocysteine/selenocysteine methylase